jgi:WD40 repeat protein/energy-coupling factor transporter ATP-binding protein EcfA2
LITADVVCSCAHVVAAELGADASDTEAPTGSVRVEFPILGGRAAVDAVVMRWIPVSEDGRGDIVLLRLAEPVLGARPVRLVGDRDVWEHRFRVLGFPAGRDDGVWTAGRLRGPQGTGWIQMNVDDDGPPIERGFSGAPVWDETLGGVVGMTVATDGPSRRTTAYLIPAVELIHELPELRQCPYRGLEPFEETDAELFHGRGEEIDRLSAIVDSAGVVAVVGPSGSGKSSLVRAGLLPRIRRRQLTVTIFRPVAGAGPVEALAKELLPVLEPGLDAIDRLGPKLGELAAQLADNGSAALVGADVAANGGADGHLIFLDQLEELTATEPDTARDLVLVLIAMAGGAPVRRAGGVGLRVVMTLRSESAGELVTSEIARSVSTMLVAAPDGDQLLAAIVEPVTGMPGVSFEPGLPARIVNDAAREPGRLPLVEFALTRLWEKSDHGRLTHAAYDEMGGVAGALANYADLQVYSALAASDEAELTDRLLVQLARPDDRGGFVRRPARVEDLDVALAPVLRRLTETRLVVVARVDGIEIADLAHEALIHQWEHLRTLLEGARDFRAWQELLRQDMARWREAGGGDVGLLRGAALAISQQWLKDRVGEISVPEREYIRLSTRYQRRDVRRWRLMAALIAVLALAAGTLAAVSIVETADIRHALRIQSSQVIAQEAERRAGVDPATALQLALAAWHNSGATPQAYEALLQQYLGAGFADAVYPGIWQDQLDGMMATADGRVVAMLAHHSDSTPTLTVWTGFPAGHPARWDVPIGAKDINPVLSPDGRTLAVATRDGGVQLWDVEHRSGPVMLHPPDTDPANDPADTRDLGFSPDSTRLLQARANGQPGAQGPAIVTVWDIQRRLPVPVGPVLPPGWDDPTVTFGADANTLIVSDTSPASDNELRNHVLAVDLATGQPQRGFDNASAIVSGGAAVVNCALHQEMHVVDTRTGADRAGPRCPSEWAGQLDATGRYLVTPLEVPDGRYEMLTLIDVATGKWYQATAPWSEAIQNLRPEQRLATFPGPDGSPTVLAAVGTALFRLRTTERSPGQAPGLSAVPSENTADSYLSPLSPDRRYWADIGDAVQLVDAHTYQIVSSAAEPGDQKNGHDTPIATFTSDGRHLVVSYGDKLTVYAVPGLHIEQQITLPVPADLGAEHDTNILTGWVTSVAAVGGAEIVALHGGTLSRWDVGTGRSPDAPLAIGHDTEDARQIARDGEVFTRPGHPGQVLVTGAGNVRLWDLDARRELPPIDVGPLSRDTNPLLLPDPGGSRFAALTAAETIVVWDIDNGHKVSEIAAPDPQVAIVGFGPHDTLVTVTQSASYEAPVARIWDLAGHRLLASVPAPIPNLEHIHHWTIHDDRLIAHLNGYELSIPLNADTAFTQLCRSAARDFTRAERQLLPAGADHTPPCG